MERREFKQLLDEAEDKLSIFTNIEIIKTYSNDTKTEEYYDLVSEYLSDEEIIKLLDYAKDFNYPDRKKLILMISDSELLYNILQDDEKIEEFKQIIWQLVRKLNDSDKEKLLNRPDWIKNHKLQAYDIKYIIKSLKESARYTILLNKTLVKDMLQIADWDIAEIVSTLELDEEKDKLIDIYQFRESDQVKIVKTYSDEGKARILSITKFGEYEKTSILRTFEIDNLITYINNPETDLSDIKICEIIEGLDTERQKEFISKLNNVNVTINEKREIIAKLKPETKKEIDAQELEPDLANALNVKTDDIWGEIIVDLSADLEQYRGLDRILSIDPTKFDEFERDRFKQLCTICPELTVESRIKEGNVGYECSTASEYIEAEKWIEHVLDLLKPEYTTIQKIAIIDNEIGKRISYSPDFDTEVFKKEDARALYKIISSGYGVCNGIARVEQYLFDRAGLDLNYEIVSSGNHAFIKLIDAEFELSNGEKVVGTTILDPTWNLAAHRFGGKPKNFCISYEEARKSDIFNDGEDSKCHKNDEKLSDATFNLDDASLRNLFKSVELADENGNFLIKYLIDKSIELHKMYADDPLKDCEEQFLLLQKVYPEFPNCPDSTMAILKCTILENEFLKYDRCVINRVYEKSDEDKKPITFAYFDFGEVGERFYYVDKEKGECIDISKEDFLKRFECYEYDLANSNGVKPWENSKQNKEVDLAKSSGTIGGQEGR